uniref:Uncharacterized protein n=1 Tax=Rhizophora mucronata TaxID=61149 RepID=A0A2P2QYT8_RHIMU
MPPSLYYYQRKCKCAKCFQMFALQKERGNSMAMHPHITDMKVDKTSTLCTTNKKIIKVQKP